MLNPAAAFAQTILGDWRGPLEAAPGAVLTLDLHVTVAANGSLIGTLDSVEQNAFGMPIGDVALVGDQLRFTVPSVEGSYEATWDAAAKGWRGTWRQYTLSLPLNLAPFTPATKPAPAFPATWTVPDDARIAALIDARMAKNPGAAMVVGVVEPGGKTRIVGRVDGKPLVNAARAQFEIGSITKTFTALLLADMAVRGEVSLDDAAATFLPPGATMPARAGRQISLRHLAAHRSGLPRLPANMTFANPVDPYADYDEKALLAFLGSYRLTRDIGAQSEYSNLGFGLLGYLLARRADQTYDALLRARVLAPFSMKDTRIPPASETAPMLMPGHDDTGKATGPWHLNVLAGAGGLRSDMADMLAYAKAMMAPQKAALGAARALALGMAKIGDRADATKALGWMVLNQGSRQRIFHNGATGGYRAALLLEPQSGRAVAILTATAAMPGPDDFAIYLLTGFQEKP